VSDAWTALVSRLAAEPDVEEGRALSSEGLMVEGKLFAFEWRDALVVKLPRERGEELIAAGRAERMRMGKREMREWVSLGDAEAWDDLAEEARTYVGAMARASDDPSRRRRA
jgi:hypothetical protein